MGLITKMFIAYQNLHLNGRVNMAQVEKSLILLESLKKPKDL